MEKRPSFGIGNLDVPDKYDDSEQKKEADDDNASNENTANSSENDEEPIGEDAMMYIGEADGKPNEVAIKCEATACIFNQQGNCRADEVSIRIGQGQGGHARGTYCETFQTPNESNEE